MGNLHGRTDLVLQRHFQREAVGLADRYGNCHTRATGNRRLPSGVSPRAVGDDSWRGADGPRYRAPSLEHLRHMRGEALKLPPLFAPVL